MSDRKQTAWAALVLFGVICAVFFPYLFGDRTLEGAAAEVPSLYHTGATPMGWNVGVLKSLDPGAPAWQTEPEFQLEHHQLAREHTLPLWNPYSGFGQPLAANMQPQPYFPLAWIVEAHPSPRAYNWFIALRFYAAALFMLLYLRFFVPVGAACGGAVAFAFTGYFVLYPNMPQVSVEILAPALLWAIEWLARGAGARGVAALALVVACTIFGGMPESAFLAFGLAAAYAIVRLRDPDLPTRRLAYLGAAAGGAVVGVLLAGVLLVPFFEFIGRSLNQHSSPGFEPGLGFDPWFATSLAQYVLPLAFGPPWNAVLDNFSGYSGIRGYWGIVPGLFAALALVGRLAERVRARPATWSPELFFAAAAAFFLLKRFGNPLVQWTGPLPGFRLIQFPKYEEAEIGCCIAALCAFGIARMTRPDGASPTARWVAAVLTLLTVTGAAVHVAVPFASVTIGRKYLLFGFAEALVALTLAGVIIALPMLGGANAARLRAAAAALVLADVLACFFVPMFYLIDHPAPITDDPAKGAPYVSFLQTHTAVSRARVFGENAMLYPQWSAAFDLLDDRDLEAIYTVDYLPFVRALLAPADPATQLRDRFTGDEGIHLDDPRTQRFFALTSTEYIATTERPTSELTPLELALRGSGRIGPTLHGGTFSAGGRQRRGVLMHPPDAQLSVPLPAHSAARTLEFSIAEDAASYAGLTKTCGGAVGFTISARTPQGRTQQLFHREIDPKHVLADRRWFDETIDLRPYAHGGATLLFATDGGPRRDTCAAYAVWGPVRVLPAPAAHRNAPALDLAFSSPDALVYRDAHVLPRLAAFTSVQTVTTTGAALAALAAPAFDPFRQAVVTAGDAATHAQAARLRRAAPAAVIAGTLAHYGSADIEGAVTTPRAALVVLNDTAFPGWNASVDGVAVPTVLANGIFRGVFVEPGRHHIRFLYQPRSFTIGIVMSALAGAIVILLFCAPLLMRRKTSHDA